MHELPIVYYNTKNAWLGSPIFCDWFSKHHLQLRTYVERCENDNSLKLVDKLMLDEDLYLHFAEFELNDLHQTLLRAGEREVCVEN